MPKVADAVRMFAPERWGQVDRFRTLSSTTYNFRGHEKRVLAGVENHFHKALTLFGMAERLLPSLAIDESELEEKGFTSAQNARNLAAVLEGVITELYSVVDCTAKVLHIIYGPTSRGFRESTRRLFAETQGISGSFPDRLKVLIGASEWYEDLRKIRDELTHRDVGSCSHDRETGLVRYYHSSLWDGERLKPIEDVFGWARDSIDAVNFFIGTVFHELNSNIVAGTVTQMCGMVQGRMLMRLLDAAEPIDFNNGACLSAQWFDKPDEPRCPFVDNCGAYNRRASSELLRSIYGEGD
ncbi:hypothetical protein O6V14_02855 [Sphingomonas faeni]|uniref:hypothetical protein n=1 Tax=Sphingomonas faeni TaxID=185950 RepID=UPI00335F9C48